MEETNMKAVILCAGKGSRIHLDYPKCLIQVDGDSILNRNVRLLKECGIDDVIVVVGYEYKKITNQLVSYYYNEEWFETEEFFSLMCARDEFNDKILVLYGNVLLNKNTIKRVMRKKGKVVALYNDKLFCGIVKFNRSIIPLLYNREFVYKKYTLPQVIDKLKDMGKDVIRLQVNISNKVHYISTVVDIENLRKAFNKVIV